MAPQDAKFGFEKTRFLPVPFSARAWTSQVRVLSPYRSPEWTPTGAARHCLGSILTFGPVADVYSLIRGLPPLPPDASAVALPQTTANSKQASIQD